LLPLSVRRMLRFLVWWLTRCSVLNSACELTFPRFALQNSFEQLCINLANEALQQHFNYNIFQAEMNIYRAEDVPLPPLEYRDNQVCGIHRSSAGI
jgi:hypothetical protein